MEFRVIVVYLKYKKEKKRRKKEREICATPLGKYTTVNSPSLLYSNVVHGTHNEIELLRYVFMHMSTTALPMGNKSSLQFFPYTTSQEFGKILERRPLHTPK